MAKSIRSKSKLGSRNVKRYNPKSDYAVVQAARLHQTASRLAAKNKHGRTVAEEEADLIEGIEGDEKMIDAERGAIQGQGAADADANDESKGWYHQKQLSLDLREKGRKIVTQSGNDFFEAVSYALLGLCDPSSLSTSMFQECDTPSDSDSDAGYAMWQRARDSPMDKMQWLL